MHNEINMSKFLSRYCNLIGNNLSKITHEDVRVLFPKIKRASFEEVSQNPKLLAIGKVVYVNDGKNVIPYYTPNVDFDILDEPTPVNKKEEKRVINKKKDYAKMSIYELRCILRRKFNSCSCQRKARCELEKRGIVLSKKYNRCEEKREVEKEKNEKY